MGQRESKETNADNADVLQCPSVGSLAAMLCSRSCVAREICPDYHESGRWHNQQSELARLVGLVTVMMSGNIAQLELRVYAQVLLRHVFRRVWGI